MSSNSQISTTRRRRSVVFLLTTITALSIAVLATPAIADHYHGGWMSAVIDANGLVTITAETRWDNELLHPQLEGATGIVRSQGAFDIRFEILDEIRNVQFSSWTESPAWDPRLMIDIESTTEFYDLSNPAEGVRRQSFTLDFADLGLPYGTYIIYWTDRGWAFVNNQDPYPASPPWSLECKIIYDGTPRSTPFIQGDFYRVVERGQNYSENLNAASSQSGCLTLSNTCEDPWYIWSVPAPNSRTQIAEGISAIGSGACQLKSVRVSLYDWAPSPVDVDVSVWDDDGFGRPGTELARVTIPQESVLLWSLHGWGADNIVDLDAFGLTGNKWHVVVDAPTGVPGVSGVYLLSDPGSFNISRGCYKGAGNTSASVYYTSVGYWESMAEHFGNQAGFLIFADVCCEAGEEPLSYQFISGQTPPRWGPLYDIPGMTVDPLGQIEIPAASTADLEDINPYGEPGDYRLKVMVTDATGQYMEVSAILDVVARWITIDIKPGSDPNSINCTHGKNTFPVAVLTTPDFDATTIDPTTASFGASGLEDAQEIHGMGHLEDVDGDGDIDMVFHFRWSETNLLCHQEFGSLGYLLTETVDGIPVRGVDAISPVIPLQAGCNLEGTSIHNKNEVLAAMRPDGRVGFDDYDNGGGKVFFPRGTCNMHLYTSGPAVGGVIPGYPDGVVATGYYSTEFAPSENGSTGTPFRIFNSSLAGDVQVWPPEFCDGSGKPIIKGGMQNLVTEFNDLDGTPRPGGDLGGDLNVPLGVEIKQRSLAKSDVQKRQDLIFLWRITNISTETINDMYFGYFLDHDLGDAYDDRTAVLETDAGLIALGWDSDFNEVDFDGEPGIVGFTFLEYPAGATVNYSGLMIDEHQRTDASQYDRLSGALATETDRVWDARMFLSVGPFNLQPGEDILVSGTLFFGLVPDGTTELPMDPSNPLRPLTTSAELADLLQRRPQVQDYYDAQLANQGLVKTVAQLPASFGVEQNYPNPFNAGTVIPFELNSDQQVHIEVFDVLGRSVATLVDERMPAGRHQAVWDGRDSAGRAVASGTYFYRLTADQFEQTKKMVLLK